MVSNFVVVLSIEKRRNWVAHVYITGPYNNNTVGTVNGIQ